MPLNRAQKLRLYKSFQVIDEFLAHAGESFLAVRAETFVNPFQGGQSNRFAVQQSLAGICSYGIVLTLFASFIIGRFGRNLRVKRRFRLFF